MAMQDYTHLLGKRVGFYLNWIGTGLPPKWIEGKVIAFIKYHPDSSPDNVEVLFLEDGLTDPDFINLDEYELLEDNLG